MPVFDRPLKISNAEPGCDQRFAQRGIEQEGAKSYDCGPPQSYPWYDEIVMFVLNGDEAEAVATRHAVNSHAPVGPATALWDVGCDQ